MIKRSGLAGALCALAIVSSGCGSGKVSPKFAVNGISNVMSLAEMRWDGQDVFDRLLGGFSEKGIGIESAGDVGQVSAVSELSSLQFYISTIQLCNTMTISGSSYSNASGCVYLIGSSTTDNAYTTFKVADASTDSSTSWVDLMSKTSISTFAATTASIAAGTYNYGIIEVRKPFKMNAKFSATNAANIRTCTGGTVTSSGSGNDLRETTTVSDMTSCTQATATLGGQGGGRFFKFQSPITVSSGTTYTLDMVFNPIGAVVGGNESAGGWGTEATYKDGTRVMVYPNLDVAPVLRKSGEKTIREQYTLSGITGLTGGTVLIDLYYVGALTNVGTGSIVSAQARIIHGSTSTVLQKMNAPYSITSGSSTGVITLKDWQSNDIVTSLTRSTTQTAGGTQTVSLNAATFTSASGGSNTSATISATATFNGVTVIAE